MLCWTLPAKSNYFILLELTSHKMSPLIQPRSQGLSSLPSTMEKRDPQKRDPGNEVALNILCANAKHTIDWLTEPSSQQ